MPNNVKMRVFLLLLPFIGLFCTGCSMTKLAARQTTEIMIRSIPVYERETDLQRAKQAMPGNLKMMEGLLEVIPDDAELLFTTLYSYTLYTTGFMEEKIDMADKSYDFEKKTEYIRQASEYYERAVGYGLRAITLARDGFVEAFEGDVEGLSLELKYFKNEHVPVLFWTAYAWVSLIILNTNDPAKLALLPKVELIMQRVMELDEHYFFGGAHMFYGAYYGGRPPLLGGDPAKAKHHLEKAIEISRGKYLMTKFLLAKYYAVAAQDRALFEKTLKEIIAAPRDLFPEQGLANRLARRNAERWLTYADELFL